MAAADCSAPAEEDSAGAVIPGDGGGCEDAGRGSARRMVRPGLFPGRIDPP